MKKLITLFSFLALIAVSCKDEDTTAGTFTSEKETFYNGKAWTSIQVDDNGNPVQASIILDDAALNSLDTSSGVAEYSISTDFNNRATSSPFKHAYINWNPHGHDPLFVYGKPHFDFHFYMVNESERSTIPPYNVDSSKFLIVPSADYFPPNYINPGGGVPGMGVHWIDITSPEFSQPNPQPFTQTLIYGSYNGKVTFIEPMITLEFLKNTTNFERSIPQPAKYQTSGYYPTKFRVWRHEGVTEVILSDFVLRQAS